jgi:16S rRNA processing protein RimM
VTIAGTVGRPHGLDGSFYVNAPRSELLAVGVAVTVAGATATVTRAAGTAARPIVRLSGYSDRTAAEALRGEPLVVADAEPPPLGPDEYRAEDLEGARVVDGEHELGIVRQLFALPSCECLSVTRSDGGSDLLIPLVRDAIRSIDIDRRIIDVDRAFLGEAGAGE